MSEGDYAYNPPPAGINRDAFDTAWYGTELKLVTRRIERHTVVVGAELQRDYRDAMRNFDTVPVSYTHLTLPTKEDECRSRWSPYH